MSKLNHSRPYLKYIDNLRRENKKANAKYQQSQTKRIIEASHRDGNRVTFWDKMAAIELSSFEENKIFDLFDVAGKYFDTSYESISLIIEKGKGKKRTSLKRQADEIYSELVKIGEDLIYLELNAQIKGRKIGIFEWLELLKPKLMRDGGDDFCHLLYNHILKDAIQDIDLRLGR